MLWGFIRRYAPGVSPETHPRLDRLVGYAVRYFPRFRAAGEALPAAERGRARGAGGARRGAGGSHEGSTDAEALQAVVYEVGAPALPRHRPARRRAPTGGPASPQTWFATIYQVLLGEERGPRFGSFVALYGVAETRALIAKALAGELLREHEAFVAERARPAAE